MAALIFLTTALTLVLMGGLAVVLARRHRDRVAPPGQGVTVNADGVTIVPVLGAEFRGGLLGVRTRNSIGPKLSLDAQGLTFKVLKQDRWAYGELTRVHVARGLFGPLLDLRTPRGALTVTLRDLATARQVLQAMPRTAPLSQKALKLRDEGV